MKKIPAYALFAALVLALFVASRALAGDMPQAGTQAPAFTLKNQEGKDVALKDFHGKWVVLYFYPKDFTSGCSLEAHNFQEDLKQYLKKNAVIVGVSVDSPDSHKSFCAKEGLGFTLLADKDHAVSALYGSTMGLGPVTVSARHTFLVNPEGGIAKTYDSVNPATHSAEVLADLDTLQAAEKK